MTTASLQGGDFAGKDLRRSKSKAAFNTTTIWQPQAEICSVNGAESRPQMTAKKTPKKTRPERFTALCPALLLLPHRGGASPPLPTPSSLYQPDSVAAAGAAHPGPSLGRCQHSVPWKAARSRSGSINRHRWRAFPPFARSPSHGYDSTKTALFCQRSRVIKQWRCAAV